MVVVTLETTTTSFQRPPDGSKALTDKKKAPVNEQSVVSKDVLRRHRRTRSPDKILFLKVREVAALPPLEQCSHKRPALESRDNHTTKKARVVLVAAPRRRVHFQLIAGVVKTTVRVFDRVETCDVASIWWSGNEMMEIVSRERSAVSVMSFCCDHYASEVLNLMKLARDKTSIPGMATMESSSPVWVANSLARGLERDIVQGFKQRKRQVIRKVLESQRVLKLGRHDVAGELAPPELHSRLLSTQYQRWSHPMVRFAQVLAEGDAQVVIDNASVAAPPIMEAF